MRGALLMCLLAVCAALSFHYVRQTRADVDDNRRSDPLVSSVRAFRLETDATKPKPIIGRLATIDADLDD